MGVYRFAFAGVQVTRIPGLACIDCAALPDLPEGAQCPIPAATWADGFGVWHARVTTTPDAPQVALAAIVHELEIRGDLYDHDASMIGVTLADPKLYTYGPDTAVYVETLEETTTP